MKRFIRLSLFCFFFYSFLPAAFSQKAPRILKFSPNTRGFIQTWLVRGPFPKKSTADDTTDFLLPEGGSHRVYTFRSIGKVISDSIQKNNPKLWQLFIGTNYKIDFQSLFSPNSRTVAYACAWIQSPKKQAVLVKFGSDDGSAIWLNGQEIASVPLYRGMKIDDNTVSATLKKGLNFLLVRVFQGGGGWEFCLRLTHPEGTPLTNVAVLVPGRLTEARILSLKAKAISTQTFLLRQKKHFIWNVTINSHSNLSRGPAELPVRVTIETEAGRVLASVFNARLPVNRENHLTRMIDPSKLVLSAMKGREKNLPETRDAIFFLHTQIFAPTKKLLREQRTPIYYY